MRGLSSASEASGEQASGEQASVWCGEQVPPWVQRLHRPAAYTRAAGLAFVLFEQPELPPMQRFLEDFGLVTTHADARRLALRGSGPAPFIYQARRGPGARFVGLGFVADDAIQVQRLAGLPGAQPSWVGEQQGVPAVLLHDPAGFEVHVLAHWQGAQPLGTPELAPSSNSPGHTRRLNTPVRRPLAPAPVSALSHVVLQVRDFGAVSQWYMHTLGLLPSDVQVLDSGEPNLVFLRLDRGAEPTDHHTLVIAGGITNAYMHSAYEVPDLDAMGQGHQWLRSRGWRPAWGMGRHLLGSQLFDYWFDPSGHELEHMADSDRFDNTVPEGYSRFDRRSLWMWGADLPRHMAPPRNPLLLLRLLADVARGRLQAARVRQVVRAMSRKPRSWLA
jgi:catechol-2,3-dioxygenase